MFCGGKSPEHEVSLLSAISIYNALDKNKYNISLVGIDKNGNWLYSDRIEDLILESENIKKIHLNSELSKIFISKSQNKYYLIDLTSNQLLKPIDIVFPVIHGEYGEDGKIQGFFDFIDIPYVGCKIIGSAIGIDKDVMKRLLDQAGVNIVNYICINNKLITPELIDSITSKLNFPVIIKPAKLGSSIGITKVNNIEELDLEIKKTFQFDDKILIEEFVECREFEISLLGSKQNPKISVIGEITTKDTFYTFDSKYVNSNISELIIPAIIDEELINNINKISLKLFEILEIEGLARADFFYSKNGDLYLNEINTMPGFTKSSMYPMLWQQSGMEHTDLLDELIRLGMKQ